MIYQKLFRTGENWLENERLFITALKPRGLIQLALLYYDFVTALLP